MIDVLRRNGSVDFVHVRHEEYGVFAAVAEARLTGNPVAMCGTAGAGVAHLINGLLDARKERAPAVAGSGVMSGAEPGWSALQGLAGWAWLAAIAGFAPALAARRLSPGSGEPRPAAARSPGWQRAAVYANQAVLPFYLLHEPVIVAAAWIIVRSHAPIGVEYPALMAVSLAATLAIYELAIRRYRPTRFLFGMKAVSARP